MVLIHQFRDSLTRLYVIPTYIRFMARPARLANQQQPLYRLKTTDINTRVAAMTSTTQTEPSIPADRKFRTSDGMFTVSSDHTIKSWNSAAERIFGITSEQAIGRKCHEVLCAKNGSNRVKCNRNCMVMSNAVKGRTTRDFDIDCKTRSGDIKTLNMSVVLTKAD